MEVIFSIIIRVGEEWLIKNIFLIIVLFFD